MNKPDPDKVPLRAATSHPSRPAPTPRSTSAIRPSALARRRWAGAGDAEQVTVVEKRSQLSTVM
jgi:hypothetical protein